MYSLKLIEPLLNNLFNSNLEIKGAAIFSRSGLSFEPDLSVGIDNTINAALTAAVISLGERLSQEMRMGELEQILLAETNGFILIMTAGESVTLTISINNQINVSDIKNSSIFIECKKTCEKIAEILKKT